jgi:sugar phosphate isomerase/epimerase
MSFTYAISTLRWKTPNLEQMLATLHEHGWDGWESRQSLDWLGSSARVKGICDSIGVQVAAIVGANVDSVDPTDQSHEINRRRIEFASDLECGIFVAKGPKRYDRETTEEDLDQMAEIYEGMAVYAEPLGVTVVYHPHRGHVVDTKEEWQRFIPKLDVCKLCMDMSHSVFWDWDPVEAAVHFKDIIKYVHLHDHRPDGFSLEIGDAMMCDFPKFLKSLEDLGYEGWITACPGRIERDESEKIARNRAYLRSIGY